MACRSPVALWMMDAFVLRSEWAVLFPSTSGGEYPLLNERALAEYLYAFEWSTDFEMHSH